jgi:paraquat-inducible protein B
MDPGPGKAQRRFVGLDRPPPVSGNTDGTRLVLHARRLGSISPGAPLDYLGLRVGAVEDYKLVDDGRRFDIDVFVRAPYDKLVHRDTRFWDAGAVRISTGSQGVSAELTAPEALLSGAISFETPPELAAGPPAKPGDAFDLHDDRDRARGAPIGQRVAYLVNFRGAVGNLSVGAAVKLRGFRVGEVVDVSLGYDALSGSLETPVTIELEPARLKLDGVAPPADGDWTGSMNGALERMIQQGLRARLDRSTPVIGGAQVTLAFVPGAPSATLGTGGPHPEIPAAPSNDISGLTASASEIMTKIDDMPLPQIAQSLHQLVDHVEGLVSSPAVEQSVQHLDRSLSHLDRITQEASVKLGPLIDELRRTADAAQATVSSANDVLGGGAEQD